MSETPAINAGSTMEEPETGPGIPSHSGGEAADIFDKERFERFAVAVVMSITALAFYATRLDQTLKSIGGNHDSKHVRDEMHGVQVTVNQTVSDAIKNFETMSHMIRNRRLPGVQEILRFRQWLNEFMTLVRVYANLQRQIVEQMKVTYLQQYAVSNQIDNDNDQVKAVDIDEAQSQVQGVEEALEIEQGMRVESEKHIEEIESDILDINEVVRQLAPLVQEHGGEVVLVVDLENLGKANEEIKRKRKEIKKRLREARLEERRKFANWKLCGYLVGFAIIPIIYLLTKNI